MNLSKYNKAIAGGVISLVVGEVAHFGFHPGKSSLSLVSVVVTGVVSYLVGHIAVYLSPANKSK